MGRYRILHEIERLDPVADHQRIMHLSFGYEFAWDSIRALEIALYKTYCVPSISGLLDRTGEFYQQTQRRYDDTAILMAEMCEWGYESGRGKAALERMNWVHSHFKIPNDDYLYVLSMFIYEPLRWIDRFGWRPTCVQEQQGYYYFWRAIGQRMGITGIPPSFEAFEAWSLAYEQEQYRFADTNQRIGTATCELFASWFPRFVRPLVRHGIYAMFDDRTLAAFGFPTPWPVTRSLVQGVLKMRGRVVRWFPPRREPHFFTDNPNRTYRNGYRIEELGPPRHVALEKARDKTDGGLRE